MRNGTGFAKRGLSHHRDYIRPTLTSLVFPAGLFFCRRLRSHTRMDPDLKNIIRQALGDALAAGRDQLSQTELAVRAVQRARPDMTASDALAAVSLMQRS